MQDKENLYKNYASIAVFEGTTEEKFTHWSKLYFDKVILKHFPSNKSISVLEIGCGYGRYLKAMKEEGYSNTKGVDISEEQVKYANDVLKMDNVYLDDALSFLKKSNTTYDLILSLDVFEHLELEYSINLVKAIHEKLNEGGKLIIQVPNGISFMNPIFHSDITHLKSFSSKSLNQLMMLGGFKITKSYALPPIFHGFKSGIRLLVWKILINPFIKLLMYLINGDKMGGIYTSNILMVAKKTNFT